MVDFLDLRAVHDSISHELTAAMVGVLDSGMFILGRQLEAFERELAAHEGVAQAVGVGNGLDALVLALRAVGVEPGSEVVVPSHTFVATWLAVSQAGARPIPVEPDPATGNLDPDALEAALTRQTAAIVPVHLYGQPANVARITQIATAHGIPVVFDGAQSVGARFRGDPVARYGTATTLSFYPGKNLGALGDGSAVLTDSPDVADRVRLLRNYGSRTKYVHEVAGQNSRLDELQAAVLRVKLRYLNMWNERRGELAALYLAALADCPLLLPTVIDDAVPVWHLFVVRTALRDQLQAYLAQHSIQTLIHYPTPPHLQPAYHGMGWTLPVAEELARTVLSLPMGPHLTADDVGEVSQAVRRFLTGGRS